MTNAAAINHAKRCYNKSLWDIFKVSLGTGLGSALPTPTIEVPKQIAISVGDLALCFHIYKEFFEEEIKDSNHFLSLMKRAGLVTVAGGAIVYIGYKAARED